MKTVDIFFELSIDQWINLIISLSTLFTLICTYFILRESTKMRRMYITPDISIYLHFAEASPTIMFISIENIGLGTACNVKFKFLKDYQFYHEELDGLQDKGILQNGIKNIFPRQLFKYFVNDLSENFDEKKNQEIIIMVSFDDVTGKHYKKTYNLSVLEFLGGGKFTPPETYIGRISFELEKIKELYKKDISLRSKSL